VRLLLPPSLSSASRQTLWERLATKVTPLGLLCLDTLNETAIQSNTPGRAFEALRDRLPISEREFAPGLRSFVLEKRSFVGNLPVDLELLAK
jgi:hypothetical protein